MSQETTSEMSGHPTKCETDRGPIASGLLIGMVAALLAGLLIWAVHWFIYPVYLVPEELSRPLMFPPPEYIEAQRAAQSEVALQHALLFMGMFGAVLGLFLSIGEFICRRTLRGAALGIAGGLVGGALSGCLAGFAGHALYYHLLWNVEAAPNVRSVLPQVLMLAVLGAGLGITFGALAGRVRTIIGSALYGLLAGILAGILYPFLVISLLPPANIDLIVPFEADVTLVWFGVTSVLIGLFVVNGALKSAPPASPCQKVAAGTSPSTGPPVQPSMDKDPS